MTTKKLFRYTSNGEGTFSAGKRLLTTLDPHLKSKVLAMVDDNKSWLIRPQLSNQSVKFYWTDLGKNKYEETLLPLHQLYLPNITCETNDYELLFEYIIYEDSYQVAVLINK